MHTGMLTNVHMYTHAHKHTLTHTHTHTYIHTYTILQLIHLYGESYSSFNADPNKLEECFSDWLNKTAASLGNSGPEMLFFVIDNSEILSVSYDTSIK